MNSQLCSERIVAVDTSTLELSITLYDKGKWYHAHIDKTSSGYPEHSTNLIPQLDLLLKNAGIKVKDLTLLGVNIGPGSFTGLRIGLSFIKTLALELKLKVFTTTTFFMILQEFLNNNGGILEDDASVIILLSGVKDEVYYAGYKFRNKNFTVVIKESYDKFSVAKEKILSFTRRKKVFIVSNFVPDFAAEPYLRKNIFHFPPTSKNIIQILLQKRTQMYKIIPPEKLFPLYIRHTYY